MLKNNKILKAQMGISIPVTWEGVPTAGGLEAVVDDVLNAAGRAGNAVRSVAGAVTRAPISMGTLAATPVGLSIYAMTKPHAASGGVQAAYENQLKKEREAAIKREQEYWKSKEDFYSNALSGGAIMTPSGVVITGYNPSTGTLSAYKDVESGNRIFLDRNLKTGVYSNPVYKDAKTGAYYEGTLDLSGDIPLVGRGENLMSYSIIPSKKLEWMVSNPNVSLKLEPIVLREKRKKPSGSQPSKQPSSEAPSGTSSVTSESAAVNPAPSNPNPENKSKWRQILEILKGKSNATSNSNYSKWEQLTLQDKPWSMQWAVPKMVSAYLRTVAPTEATFKALGWMPINSGPTYQLFPSLRPTMDRIANINSQPENQTQQQKNTEKEELPEIPVGFAQDSTYEW